MYQRPKEGILYRVILTLSASVFAAQLAVAPAKAVEVYLFKGAGDFSFINKDMHFSRGLERIADQLNKEGIHAEVRRFGSTGDAMRTIRRRKPKSVAFVGHSMGALASMSMANKMKAEGIRVAYVGTLDIPGPIGSAGSNVEWAENYWSITPVYGLLTNASSHPRAKNIHVFGTHTTMDDSKKVYNGVLNAIREIHASEKGGRSKPVETIMVENKATKPVVEKKAVVASAAPVKRLPKIDEDVVADAPIESAISTSNQDFAAVNPGTSARPTVSREAAVPDELMPINLLAAPRVGRSAYRPDPVRTASIRRAAPPDALVTPMPESPRDVKTGRFYAAGKALINKVSSLMARNGKRHKRRVEAESER